MKPPTSESRFGLFLFARNPAMARAAELAGITGTVVDWERDGKGARQPTFASSEEVDTPEHLAAVRRATSGTVVCRVNGFASGALRTDIELAIDLGADEVLIPMVRDASEVQIALAAAQVAGGAGVAVMLETCEAVRNAGEILALPVTRAFVGLNDLSIDRKDTNLFRPLVDGTMAGVAARANELGVPLGVAGLTRPHLGSPISCRLLVHALCAFGCGFTFLRRSFLRDVPVDGFGPAVAEIHAAILHERSRPLAERRASQAELLDQVNRAEDHFAGTRHLYA